MESLVKGPDTHEKSVFSHGEFPGGPKLLGVFVDGWIRYVAISACSKAKAESLDSMIPDSVFLLHIKNTLGKKELVIKLVRCSFFYCSFIRSTWI